MVSILPMVDLLGNTAVDWFYILSYFRLDTLPCYYVMGPNNTDRFYGSRSHNVFGPLKYVHFAVCVAASTACGPSLDVHRRPSRLEPVKLAITRKARDHY